VLQAFAAATVAATVLSSIAAATVVATAKVSDYDGS
jgi:hypothetical protein